MIKSWYSLLLVLAMALVTAAALAQPSNPALVYVAAAPSGACLPSPPVQILSSSGVIYTCDNGTWAAQGGGGGGGVTSLTGDGTIISNSASTGAVTLTLANTPTGTGGVVLATSPSIASPTITSSFTATGLVTLADLATQAANTVLVNATSGTASPTAQAVSSCSAAADALIWTTNTGFGCNTAIAAATATTATTATSATTATNLSGGSTVTNTTPAASTSAVFSNATLFTGGSGTTTFPYILLQPSGATAETGWSTSGTFFGINAATGFAGNFLDFHTSNTASVFNVNVTGITTARAFVSTQTDFSFQDNAVKFGSGVIQSWSSTAAYSGTNDTGLDRSAAGVVEVNLGTAAGSGGSLKAAKLLSSTNCSSGASPAVCGSSSAGSVAIPTGTNPTLVVNTTAVTAASEIVLTVDDSVTIGGTTCNSTLATLVGGIAITARTAATSFTISYNGTIVTNPLCLSYSIIN